MSKKLYIKEPGIVSGQSDFTMLQTQSDFAPVEYEGSPFCRLQPSLRQQIRFPRIPAAKSDIPGMIFWILTPHKKY